jgi:hypothetical protein
MNLDLFPLGWVHLVASLAALAVGILVLQRPTGTPAHKRRGRVYAPPGRVHRARLNMVHSRLSTGNKGGVPGPAGFDRTGFHRDFNDAVVGFFRKQLARRLKRRLRIRYYIELPH